MVNDQENLSSRSWEKRLMNEGPFVGEAFFSALIHTLQIRETIAAVNECIHLQVADETDNS